MATRVSETRIQQTIKGPSKHWLWASFFICRHLAGHFWALCKLPAVPSLPVLQTSGTWAVQHLSAVLAAARLVIEAARASPAAIFVDRLDFLQTQHKYTVISPLISQSWLKDIKAKATSIPIDSSCTNKSLCHLCFVQVWWIIVVYCESGHWSM